MLSTGNCICSFRLTKSSKGRKSHLGTAHFYFSTYSIPCILHMWYPPWMFEFDIRDYTFTASKILLVYDNSWSQQVGWLFYNLNTNKVFPYSTSCMLTCNKLIFFSIIKLNSFFQAREFLKWSLCFKAGKAYQKKEKCDTLTILSRHFI